MRNLPQQLNELYIEQQSQWPGFANAVIGLGGVRTRTLSVVGSCLVLQNNPARIQSTAAKIDAGSLNERPCFLCEKNRPSEQRGILVQDGRYTALVNPFPVLPNHFTVVANKHVRQDTAAAIEDFLNLADDLGDELALIFNGARAGASAPDHLHFQILPVSGMSLFDALKARALNRDTLEVIEFAGAGYLFIAGTREGSLSSKLNNLLKVLNRSEGQLDLINLMAFKNEDAIVVLVAPRKAHRPACFFAKGERQFVLSPAAIELSGVIVLPRSEDFERITASDINLVFKEVCWSVAECEALLAISI